MTSNRSSKAIVLALLCSLLLAAVAPAGAVSISDSSVPQEGEVGEKLTAEYTLTDLYQDPNWESWTLVGETELENVTWTLTFINPSGETIDVRNYNGQQFEHQGISADADVGTVTKVRVEVAGEVPAVEEFTYAEPETFTLVELRQTRGEAGSQNEIGSWSAHHYTAAGEADDEPGSYEARTAIEDAEAAIAEAEEVGADVSEAETSLTNAIGAYESGEFQLAVELANEASEKATQAKEDKEQSDQRSQLLLFGGAGLVVILLAGGGVWYYRQQQDDYDKLG